MNRGRRYDTEPKLNLKKVFAVIIAIIVIFMFIAIVKKLLTKETTTGTIISDSYFSIYKDNKWGVINSNGEYVVYPSYSEMIVIPNSKKGLFIVTYNVDYSTGEYKTKVLDQKNQEILKEYELVEAIQNKDGSNNLWHEKEVLRYKKDGKYGLINYSGKEILAAEYDEITAILGIENSFKAVKDGKCGIVNNEGKTVIEPKYADIDILGKDNKSGFIVKNSEGKFGIVDFSDTQVLDFKYDSIQKIYGNELYVVTVSGKQKVVNKAGEDVLTSGFDTIEQILSNQENAVIFKKSEKYGVMDVTGQILIDAKYDFLKETKTGIFIAKKENKYGIINASQEEKVAFEYASISYNEKADIYIAENENFKANVLNGEFEIKVSGILNEFNETKGYLKLRVDDEYKYYNFKFEEKQEASIFPNRTLFLSKKDGKYGYVNKTGNVVVDYIYDDAVEQNEYGYAAVKKDGKWGCIDSKGKVVKEPSYNLDNYLLVDFIKEWHLGLDINMNYYNQL